MTIELMKLFQKNPNLIDTVEGVAKRIGASASQVENDISKLVDLGILVKIPSGKSTVLVLDKKRAREIDSKIESMLGWEGGA
jgi:Fic family protein